MTLKELIIELTEISIKHPEMLDKHICVKDEEYALAIWDITIDYELKGHTITFDEFNDNPNLSKYAKCVIINGKGINYKE